MKKLFFGIVFIVLAVLHLQFKVHFVNIQGIVVDAISRAPLVGVTVIHQNKVTSTDINGKFYLKVSKLPASFRFEFAGFQPKTELIFRTHDHKIEMLPSVLFEEQEIVNIKDRYKATAKPALSIAGMPNSYRDQISTHWNTENYGLINENQFYSSQYSPLSTFSIDVDAASYANMRRFLNRGMVPPKDAIRIEELVNYFQYDYPEPSGKHPFSVSTEMSQCPWNGKHHLVHIGLKGNSINTGHLPASNLVFLLDVSGSMQDENKLPLVKRAFRLLVDQLREQDRVAIVVYAGSSGLVLPSTSGNQKSQILKSIDQLEAGGSTAGSAGIKLAYRTAIESFVEGGNNRVILATDGDFNVGTSSDAELVKLIEKQRESGVFLTILGFGTGNYQEHKMQQLAQHGNGNHAYIDNILEAKKIMINEFGGTMFTIAKDVKIQVEFNPEKVQGYRLIGYENRLLETADFNNDKKDAGEIGAGHTVTALYEIIPQGIKSDFGIDIDSLKYQNRAVLKESDDEWMQVKIRYKLPAENISHKLVVPIKALIPHPSNNFNWAAGVASFGMMIRDSEYKGRADYQLIDRLCKSSLGEDLHGYRAEFLRLVESTQLLAGK